MTHILIIGKNGQLGRHLCQQYHEMSSVPKATAPEITAWSRAECDVTDVDSLAEKIIAVAPDIIVNASAYTDTKQAEADEVTATLVNGDAPTAMARAAKQSGALFIHVSTDYVFDGQRRKPYLETDTINPLSAYGRSKAKGEQGIRSILDNDAVIIRTSWVFSAFGNNFLKTMLQLCQTRETLQVIVDQHGAPTFAGHLAHVVIKFIDQHQSGENVSGLYHYCDRPACSWFDFASAIIEEARNIGFPVKTADIQPISASEWPSPVVRPEYGVLNCDKISAQLGITPFPWQAGVRQALMALHTH